MASILRQIVSGPRARHPEAGLDLCYVTDQIIVTSGPSSVWPKKAYRNPVDQLVAFLDKKHGDRWAIFEFRAEGTGYPDEEVYGRIHHFPWPDHHPPPFAVMPNLMAAIRNWLHPTDHPSNQTGRVAVVHCKAGKGRSGTVATSYLVSQEGWKKEDALERFTLRRMRAGFGAGVSIPSQLRWVRYVDRWTNSMNKQYAERPVEITELHIWGLRGGVKVSVEGYIDQGRRIKNFHTFTRDEKTHVDQDKNTDSKLKPPGKVNTETLFNPKEEEANPASYDTTDDMRDAWQNVIVRPHRPIRLEGSDVNIDFERRNKSSWSGFSLVTSIAHVWFNTFFEGGYEGKESGVFEIEWEAMDGIKGSVRKGIKALDRLQVVWKYAEDQSATAIAEPKHGEPVQEGVATDWRGHDDPEKDIEGESKRFEGIGSGRAGGVALTLGEMSSEATRKLMGKDLGLRKSHDESANISTASSIHDQELHPTDENGTKEDLHNSKMNESRESLESLKEVKTHGIENGFDAHRAHEEASRNVNANITSEDTGVGRNLEAGIKWAADTMSKLKGDEPK